MNDSALGFSGRIFSGDHNQQKVYCSTSFDTKKKVTEKERVTDMSFVGVGLCSDGFLVFGDSKATKVDPLGNLIHDVHRGNVQKIFKGNGYVVAAHGHNQIADANGVICNIEDIINRYIKEQGCSYSELLIRLLEFKNRYALNKESNYGFVVGAVDEFGPFVQFFLISEGITASAKERDISAYCGGSKWYVERSNLIYFTPNSNMCEGEKFILNSFSWIIELADFYGTYNPVGGPIQIEKVAFQDL